MADLYYKESITIDKDLLEVAYIVPYEKVQVVNLNTVTRPETYTLEGSPGSGMICLNSPAARLGTVGDEVISITYTTMSDKDAKKHKPKNVLVDKNKEVNKIL